MTIIERFREAFFTSHSGAALVISPSNRLYLTQFSSSDGAVLVTENDNYLIVDFRYYEMAKEKCNDFKVILSEKGLLKTVKDLCNDIGVKTIFVEDNYLTVSQNKRVFEVLENLNVLYLGDLIENLRVIKTADEIRKIKESQKLTDAAYSRVLEILRVGITENDVAAEIEYFFRKNGAEAAFKTIAVSGKKSSCPHGEPTDALLTENSFLTMDFGAKLDGYCSDMTRTVVLGKCNDEMREIYDIVYTAQHKALEVIKKDVLGNEVDFAARDYISQKGYSEAFGHSTGHALGIDVHEMPSFSMNYKKSIPENSVLSVEPGIYLEGKYGVRIEDIVVITANGYENLTKSDKKLIEIN